MPSLRNLALTSVPISSPSAERDAKVESRYGD